MENGNEAHNPSNDLDQWNQNMNIVAARDRCLAAHMKMFPYNVNPAFIDSEELEQILSLYIDEDIKWKLDSATASWSFAKHNTEEWKSISFTFCNITRKWHHSVQ